jgi:hypothetical protein
VIKYLILILALIPLLAVAQQRDVFEGDARTIVTTSNIYGNDTLTTGQFSVYSGSRRLGAMCLDVNLSNAGTDANTQHDSLKIYLYGARTGVNDWRYIEEIDSWKCGKKHALASGEGFLAVLDTLRYVSYPLIHAECFFYGLDTTNLYKDSTNIRLTILGDKGVAP